MNTKARQNSNVANRLSVPNLATLRLREGTIVGEVVLQADIGILYKWEDSIDVDDGVNIINVGTGSWRNALAISDNNGQFLGVGEDKAVQYYGDTILAGNSIVVSGGKNAISVQRCKISAGSSIHIGPGSKYKVI